jgi:hypothetical protein
MVPTPIDADLEKARTKFPTNVNHGSSPKTMLAILLRDQAERETSQAPSKNGKSNRNSRFAVVTASHTAPVVTPKFVFTVNLHRQPWRKRSPSFLINGWSTLCSARQTR